MTVLAKPAHSDGVLEPISRLGLPRLLRLGVLASLPAIWYEIAVLHFRGAFQSRPMWVPVTVLPAVMVAGAVSVVDVDEHRSRKAFMPLALLTFVIGAVGTFFHARGVTRQMGGVRNLAYNTTTGPPLQAPAQVALFGLLGALASSPQRRLEDVRLVAWARGVNASSYVLLMTEAGAGHWLGGFYNPVMLVPLALSPVLIASHVAAAASTSAVFRYTEGALSATAAVAGLVGFGFHVRNVMRRGGFTWQNLFYGPPVVAPLQLTAQGTLGLLAAFFDRRAR